VSEPPEEQDDDDGPRRWPADGLDALGLGPPVRGGGPEASFVTLEKIRSSERWPRRVGIPAKRPLWGA
jgi:hypothetical protein